MYRQGELVLLPIPFTDLTSTRRRPAIVLSNDRYNSSTADIVVVGMTTNLTPTPTSFILNPTDLASGSLNRPSRVRVDKIYAVAQAIVVQRFGVVNTAALDRIRQLLADLFGP